MKHLASTFQNHQGHQKQGKSEKLSQPRRRNGSYSGWDPGTEMGR